MELRGSQQRAAGRVRECVEVNTSGHSQGSFHRVDTCLKIAGRKEQTERVELGCRGQSE